MRINFEQNRSDPKSLFAKPYRTQFSSSIFNVPLMTIIFAWQSTTLVTLSTKTYAQFGYTQRLEIYNPHRHQVHPPQQHQFYEVSFPFSSLGYLSSSLHFLSTGQHPRVFNIHWSSSLHFLSIGQHPRVFNIHWSSSLHFLSTGLQHFIWISSPTGLPMVFNWLFRHWPGHSSLSSPELALFQTAHDFNLIQTEQII